MSFKNRDCELGHCAYFPVEKWAEIPEPITDSNVNTITYIFNSQSEKLESIFSSIYIPIDELQSDGDIETKYYNIGMDTDDLVEDFIAFYGELPLMRPYYFESKLGNIKSVAKCMSILKATLDLNEGKYRKLAQSLGFTYNPIENYNMVEGGEDTTTFSGKETNKREVDSNKVGSIEVNGPVETLIMSEPDPETGVKTIDVSLDLEKKIGYLEKAASDIQAGQKVTAGDEPSLTPGTTPTTNNYTTTMDDKETGRLEGYQTTTGTTGQVNKIKAETDSPVMAKITAGAPNHPSYTDEKSFANRNDKLAHSLTRSGNIGVTTTQQMLEQERKIVRFSLVNEFYQDLVEQLCLEIWN